MLKYGLGGASLLALGGVGLALRPSILKTPGRTLQALSPKEYSTLAAAAEVILPGGNGFPTASELQIAETVDQTLAPCHPGIVAEFKQLLALLENAVTGAVLEGRFSTFTAATSSQRAEALEGWRNSDSKLLKGAFKALHGLCTASYYNQSSVQTQVGYPGVPEWVTEIRKARIQ